MRKNSFGQGLAIFLVIIGVLFVIGSIGKARLNYKTMKRGSGYGKRPV